MFHVNQILSYNNKSTVTYLELAELRISTCMPIYVPMGSGNKTIMELTSRGGKVPYRDVRNSHRQATKFIFNDRQCLL